MTDTDLIQQAKDLIDQPGRQLLTVPAVFTSTRARVDGGAGWNMSATQEVSDETFIALSLLAKRKTPGHLIFVTDEKDAEQVRVPDEPARPKGKKVASASQLMRMRLENIATEHGCDPEAYYQERMGAYNRQLADELEAIRRDKHYEQGGQW